MDQHRVPVLLGIPLAVLGGLAVAGQGRINGALGARLDDGLAAAAISFGSGLILILAVSLASPSGRSGLRAIGPALKARKFPRWYVMAGAVGAFLVLTQGLTVAVIGIALFTVALVTGQSLSGLLVDRLGISPAGKKPITGIRVISAVLTIAAVIWAVSPRFAQAEDASHWLFPVLLPLAAGFLMSFQQAMNGMQSLHYGTPLAATVMNFAVGAVILLLAWLVKVWISGVGNPLPGEWWYYLGGALGCFFICLSAWLVRGLGVLLTGLGMIAGQLLGSLALDLIVPTPGTVIAPATWLGTLLTLLAMVLATLPWPRKPLR
ncbi:DMT family transporter [Arthrobacter russicus]|jgi:transporter family-2 protein|uniref:Transporter family-2 protein n=1 Tax=Arthrobacter russicus TaxID=172040 RepID=A0ABU1J980_9MICC|nr:DMT family transporter [Arthrobacter russicus]MDR6268968.1 transporter family-2 protein [Arthrobacter russicus]